MEESAIQPTIARVEKRLENLVAANKVPGLSVAIYQKDVLDWQAGFGFSNIEDRTPVYPPDTIFRAASVSKPITACALAVMISEGLIDLDASFYDYVPDFPRKKHDFSIRQLAAHTAGIRGYKGKEYALNKPYTIRESLEVFQEDPLLFKPGTQFHYNSFGYVLLSLAMEEASGIPFEVYTREKVLIPLGMNNTIPEQPPTTNEKRTTTNQQATFYTRLRSGFRKAIAVDNRYKLAGGGYLTTVNDMTSLGKAVLHKSFYPETLDVFLKPQKIMEKSTYYGLGWEVSEDAQGRPFYGHIGNQVGGYSYFRIYPETGLIFSTLVNCTDPKIQHILDEAVAEFHDYSS